MQAFVKNGITIPGSVSTVSFDNWFQYVEIINRGTSEIWVRADGEDPVAEGDNSIVIPGNSWLQVRNRSARPTLFNTFPNVTVIKIFSVAAVPYSACGEGS